MQIRRPEIDLSSRKQLLLQRFLQQFDSSGRIIRHLQTAEMCHRHTVSGHRRLVDERLQNGNCALRIMGIPRSQQQGRTVKRGVFRIFGIQRGRPQQFDSTPVVAENKCLHSLPLFDKNTETDDLMRQESDQHGFSEQKHGDSGRAGLQLHLPAFLLPYRNTASHLERTNLKQPEDPERPNQKRNCGKKAAQRNQRSHSEKEGTGRMQFFCGMKDRQRIQQLQHPARSEKKREIVMNLPSEKQEGSEQHTATQHAPGGYGKSRQFRTVQGYRSSGHSSPFR